MCLLSNSDSATPNIKVIKCVLLTALQTLPSITIWVVTSTYYCCKCQSIRICKPHVTTEFIGTHNKRATWMFSQTCWATCRYTSFGRKIYNLIAVQKHPKKPIRNLSYCIVIFFNDETTAWKTVTVIREALDCCSPGWAIDPAPWAWIITISISLAQVVRGPV